MSGVFTAFKGVATALNDLIQSYKNISGAVNASAVTAALVLKTSSGWVARVSVTTAGTAPGYIYDANALGQTSNPIYQIPDTVGVYSVMLPANNGILVVPGTGQTVTVSYA